jgi:glucose-6-phosphate dehydrogenase assembly protein OpcA
VSTTRVAGVPERVDVAGIERELHRLWSSFDGEPSSGTPGGGSAEVTRICTLTLLGVAGELRAAHVAEVAERLSERHPCRSIVLSIAPGDGGRLAAEIALHCHTSGAPRPPVCCEQIMISASGRAVARVPALVLPLLVPDLPVYLWWSGDPPAEPGALRRLGEMADVLIVDSSAMERPADGLRAAAALAGRIPGGMRDLTWGRLTHWRDLIVQCFDPAPMRQALDRLDRVRIRTESERPGADAAAPASRQGPPPIAGLLLGGWLASRLGWEPAGPARREGTRVRTLFWRDGGGLELDVEGGPGRVLSVECAAGGTEPCAVSIARRPGGESAVQIETRLGRGRPHSAAAALSLADDATLVGAELELTGVDHVLRDAVDVVLRITQGLS